MKGFLSILFICFSFNQFGQTSITKDSICMGVSFSITAIHNSSLLASNSVDKAYQEINRIEELISSWKETSQTSEINRQAGISSVKVDLELYNLIARSKKISELTNGYFDISFASVDKIWNFSDRKLTKLPSKEAIESSVKRIDFRNIILNESDTSVFLKEKGMKIGLGAIGKGYAANQAKLIMKGLGVENGVVNASGDLASWGHKIDGSEWTIGIKDPKSKAEVMGWLNITNTSVVTSGNYEKFIELEGKRYCHIINPKTGFPVTGITSVTIICNDTEIADALATAVFILGKEDGMKLINHLKGVEGLIIDDEFKLHSSQNLNKNFYLSN
mgnify:CR=1 FL=1